MQGSDALFLVGCGEASQSMAFVGGASVLVIPLLCVCELLFCFATFELHPLPQDAVRIPYFDSIAGRNTLNN